MKAYNETYYTKPIAMNMVEDNGKIWMSLLNRNGICEIDKVRGEARICRIFDGEPYDGKFLYSYVVKVSHYLIFSPWEAKNIAIYNLECDSMIYIPLKKIEHQNGHYQKIKFWNIIQHNSDVYLLGYDYPAIVKVNLDSRQVTYITDWVDEVERNVQSEDISGYFADGHVIVGNQALISVACMNAVLELDFETGNTKIIKIDVPMGGIGGIASADGVNIWLVGKRSKTNRVCCWNIRTDRVSEYCIEDEKDDIYDPFYAPICTEKKIYFMPISASAIYEFDVVSKKIVKNRSLDIFLKKEENMRMLWWKTLASRIEKNLLIFINCDDLKWYEYNVTTGEIRNYIVRLEETMRSIDQFFDAVCLKYKKNNFIIPEKEIPLKYVVNNMELEKKVLWDMDIECLIGGKIYEQLRRDI